MTGVKLPEPISHAERCRGQIIESALAMSMYSHLVQKAVYGSVPCSATKIPKTNRYRLVFFRPFLAWICKYQPSGRIVGYLAPIPKGRRENAECAPAKTSLLACLSIPPRLDPASRQDQSLHVSKRKISTLCSDAIMQKNRLLLLRTQTYPYSSRK